MDVTLAVFKRDGSLPFHIDSLSNFARSDVVITATNSNAYEGIWSRGDFFIWKRG